MIQDILSWILVSVAVIYFARLFYIKFSGKNNGCAGCTGCGDRCELETKPKDCSTCNCKKCSLRDKA